MSNSLSPYFAFNGQARAALEHWQSVFGGTVDTLTWGQAGVTEMGPAEGLMHGQLDTPSGWSIMAADSTLPQDEVVRGGSTLAVWGDDVDLMTEQFNALGAAGEVTMPLEKQMWGALYGSVRDQFGIDWGFNITVPSDNNAPSHSTQG